VVYGVLECSLRESINFKLYKSEAVLARSSEVYVFGALGPAQLNIKV
jgi:hypothetical protein